MRLFLWSIRQPVVRAQARGGEAELRDRKWGYNSGAPWHLANQDHRALVPAAPQSTERRPQCPLHVRITLSCSNCASYRGHCVTPWGRCQRQIFIHAVRGPVSEVYINRRDSSTADQPDDHNLESSNIFETEVCYIYNMSTIDGVDYAVINPAHKWRILRSQLRFGLWALWISSGVIMQGFDITAGGQLAALPEFRKKFGYLQADGSYLLPARYLSAWNAIAPACEIVATPFFAVMLERFGRKPGILVAAVISVAGVLLQQLASDWKVHLAGRGVNGIAIGIMFTISPLWIGEVFRPELRGFFLCLFNTSIVFGQFAIVLISRGSSNITGKWQWWLPIVAMYIFPFILAVGWPFFPESPYWLVRQDRIEEARKALQRVHDVQENAFYDAELCRMQEEIAFTNELQTTGTPSRGKIAGSLATEINCFRKRNRKRTFTAMFAASAQQMIGATFVIGYATYFFELIGIKDYFNASVGLYVVMLLASTAAFPLTEIYGRRALIVRPQFALCLMLLLIGIMGCIPDKSKASYGIIALIYVWALIYQLSIGATGFVLASEVATARLRGATQGLITITNASWGLIMQFTVPYMINGDAGNLGGKVGFIFLATGLFAAIGGWFLFPETKGISFSTLDKLYTQGVKPRHFKHSAQDYEAELEVGTEKNPQLAVRVEKH